MVDKNDIESNPYIEPENYYDGYKDSIDNLKGNHQIVEFDRLCHMLFTTEDGKTFMKECENRFLIPALCVPTQNNYRDTVIFMEGLKEAFRMIRNCILSHDQRIKAADEDISQ